MNSLISFSPNRASSSEKFDGAGRLQALPGWRAVFAQRTQEQADDFPLRNAERLRSQSPLT